MLKTPDNYERRVDNRRAQAGSANRTPLEDSIGIMSSSQRRGVQGSLLMRVRAGRSGDEMHHFNFVNQFGLPSHAYLSMTNGTAEH